HLCPHGALQQLVKPAAKSARHWKLPRPIARGLSWIPGISLALAYLVLVMWPTVDISSWEPFHAYLFRIAGWGSILFAAVSLLVATFVPMAYCRYGCPTGHLIDYLRRTARSNRLQLADIVAVGLLLTAIGASYW
ncbi:MAG: 4Fe-4S binding protein, partial [Pirellulales bacterium]|nr:4Fe-4S binding protein [Pirellulales bacterium]